MVLSTFAVVASVKNNSTHYNRCDSSQCMVDKNADYHNDEECHSSKIP